MKTTLFFFLFALCGWASAQSTHTVDIPKGVKYHYCDEAIIDSAKALITSELGESPQYVLMDRIMFIGPVLWTRFQKVKTLKKIEGGNVTNLVDGKQLPGKLTQRVDDSKLVWDALRADIGTEKFTLRYASAKELRYYWSVISFEIYEPLLIVETSKHNYILNIAPKDMKLIWLDEAPR